MRGKRFISESAMLRCVLTAEFAFSRVFSSVCRIVDYSQERGWPSDQEPMRDWTSVWLMYSSGGFHLTDYVSVLWYMSADHQLPVCFRRFMHPKPMTVGGCGSHLIAYPVLSSEE